MASLLIMALNGLNNPVLHSLKISIFLFNFLLDEKIFTNINLLKNDSINDSASFLL